MELKKILDDFKAGRLSRDQAADLLAKLPYESLGFAKLDHHRRHRKGQPETVFCPGKTPEQLAIIFQRFQEAGSNVLGTRASPEHCQAVQAAIPAVSYHPVGRLLKLETPAVEQRGLVAVCTGGTADIPVAEEAAGTAEFLGSRVLRCYDVGVAGIHRLFANLDELRHANALIAIAGMEGALGSVLAGLVANPVIAVPTSVGYGASFQGLAPLLTMLNSCAEGMAVVNIDNGFGAGYIASQINLLAAGQAGTVPGAGG
jgi:NCAIR mutase (PurE)-related protein